MQIAKPLVFYIPDSRGVVQSHYGQGNLKIGMEAFTYSRLPGLPRYQALGAGYDDEFVAYRDGMNGTCPGATDECRAICYAARPVAEKGPVARMWRQNSITEDVPPIPDEATYLRLHVSGDFTSVEYISNWITRISARPDVKVWGYTRSWRVPLLLPHLENLRALSNVQLFASVDFSTPDHEVKMITAAGWRRAWIDGDNRAGEVTKILAHTEKAQAFALFAIQRTGDGVKTLICPEETKAVANCVDCGFCIDGHRNDVTFLVH